MFDEHYKKIKIYLRALAEGDINSCVILGRGGIGKTYLTFETLEELKLKEGIHYNFINSYITATELFIALERVNRLQKPKLLILDDIEYSLQDKKFISLLKSALWESKNNKRSVSYQSGTYRINTTQIDNFNGKIVVLLNELNTKNPLIKALISRGLYYHFNPNENEMRQAIMSLAQNKPYKNIPQSERIKIAQYLLQNKDNKDLSLRDLIKAYNLYLVNKNCLKIL